MTPKTLASATLNCLKKLPMQRGRLLLAALLSVACFSESFGQAAANAPAIEKAVKTDTDRLVGIFKDIHANPELAFMETRTAGIVAKELKVLGYEVKEGIGKTGVVGIMKNGAGPIVMYRADMDCNGVQEPVGLPYASTKIVRKNNGVETPVMHACGHDAHTTWLIGTAKVMAQMKDK